MTKITYRPNLLEGKEYSCRLQVTTIQEAVNRMAELYPEFAQILEAGGIYCFILSVNDLEVPHDMWGKYPIQDSDEIFISHDIGEFGLAGLWIGSLLIKYSTLTAIAISLAVNAAIYAINYFTRPDPPSSRPHDFTSASPTYNWSGIVTTYDVDRPVPVSYGKHRVGGNAVNHFISTDGDKNYWNILLNLGHGPIGGIWKSDGTGLCESNQDIPDMLVNGNPFINYDNTEWDYRLGTQDQTPIKGFDAIHTVFPIGNIKITPTGYIYTTTDVIEAIEIKLSCLAGLWSQGGGGNVLENSVVYNIKYRLYGTSTWIDDGNHEIRDKSKTALHRYYTKSDLNGRYDFKITRVSPEQTGFDKSSDLYLTAIDEIIYETLYYQGRALFAVKMLATEHLQGEMPNFEILVNGRTVMVPKLTRGGVVVEYDKTYWDPEEEVYKYANWDRDGKWISDIGPCVDTGGWVAQTTKNPIWNVTDFITSRRYGNGEHINLETIDLPRHSLEAKYAHEIVKTDGVANEWEHRFEMDGVIDGQSSSIDILSQICSTFQAYPIWAEGSYKILIDRPQTPVQMINKANIVKDSFKWAFYPLSQRPNSFTASFLDKKSEYTRDSRQIVDTLVYTNNLPLRPHNIHIPLVVRETQILRTLRHLLNVSKYRSQMIEFSGGIDSVHLQGGDSFYFSHDVNHWQIGGRILDVDGLNLTLDRPITIEQDNNYKITVRLPDPSRPGKEMFESRAVTNAPGTYEIITISSTFAVEPIPWETVYIFGLQTEVTKQFKALGVNFDENRKVAIKAVETTNAIWDQLEPSGTLIHVPVPTVPIQTLFPQDVTDLFVESVPNRAGIRIAFNKPEGDTNWFRAEILLSDDGIRYSTITPLAFGGTIFEYYDVIPGRTYWVKVVSYSKYNVMSLNPPIKSITLTAITGYIPNVTGLEIFGQGNNTEWVGRDIKFAWRPIAIFSGAGVLDADKEPLGAGEGFTDYAWKDYQVEIWVSGKMVRREYVTVPFFVYTYEMNCADNGGNPSNLLTIKVWNRSIWNILSAKPAELTVVNIGPPVPMDLQTWPIMNGVKLTWSPSAAIDHAIWMIRTKVGTDDWGEWISIQDTVFTRTLLKTEIEAHGLFPTIYFELKDVDSFGGMGGVASANAQCFAIAGLALEDYSLNAAKKLIAESLTNAQIAQNTINAAQKLVAESLTNTQIAPNTINAAQKIVGQTIIGDLIAGNTIVGGHIAANTINATQKLIAGTIVGDLIAANTINATDKLIAGTIIGNNIAANTIGAGHIIAGSISADKLSVSQLSAISANLGTITAGSITGVTVVVTGDFKTSTTVGTTKGVHLSSANNELYFYGNRGDGTISRLAYIGVREENPYFVIGFFGAPNSTRVGVFGYSDSNVGVIGQSVSGYGVYAYSSSNYSVYSYGNTYLNANNYFPDEGNWDCLRWSTTARIGKHTDGPGGIRFESGLFVFTGGGMNIGSNTDPGATNLYIVNNCSALSFTDRTPFYEGDALTEIKSIKGKDGKIDHNSLPVFVKRSMKLSEKKIIYGDKIPISKEEAFEIAGENGETKTEGYKLVGDITPKYKLVEGKIVENKLSVKKDKKVLKKGIQFDSDTGTFFKQSKTEIVETKDELGRDIGAMVSMLTVAVQQLAGRIEKLESGVKG